MTLQTNGTTEYDHSYTTHSKSRRQITCTRPSGSWGQLMHNLSWTCFEKLFLGILYEVCSSLENKDEFTNKTFNTKNLMSDCCNTQKNLTSCLWSLEKGFWNIQSTLMTSLRWNRRKWLKSINFPVVTLLSSVSWPSRGVFENMGKYNPQRQKSGFEYPWRLLKLWVRFD